MIKDVNAQLILGNDLLKLGKQDGSKQIFPLGEGEVPISSYQPKSRPVKETEESVFIVKGNVSEINQGGIHGMATQDDKEMNEVVGNLTKELDMITKRKLNDWTTETLWQAVREENSMLQKIVQSHPRFFEASFKAGIQIPPLKINFNRDISQVKPNIAKAKPLSNKELQIVQNWINGGLASGSLEESYSTWRSSVFPVRKPNEIRADGSPVMWCNAFFSN